MIIKLLEIFFTFFKIGLFTIGGGYAMIPMIKAEVIANGWASESELFNFLAISESTPGPFAVNVSTFVGASVEGVPRILGAICATLGVILPSFLIILIVFQIYKKFIVNKYVKGTMNGIKAVVIGTIFFVGAELIFKEIFKEEGFKGFDFKALIILSIIGGIFFLTKRKISPILLIVISAGLGILMYGFF